MQALLEFLDDHTKYLIFQHKVLNFHAKYLIWRTTVSQPKAIRVGWLRSPFLGPVIKLLRSV